MSSPIRKVSTDTTYYGKPSKVVEYYHGTRCILVIKHGVVSFDKRYFKDNLTMENIFDTIIL